MKKFIASVLVISIAMMGTLSYNAAAKGPDSRKGNGPRIENHGNRPSGNHGDNAFRPGHSGHNPGHNHGNAPGYKPGHNPGHSHGHNPGYRPAPRPRPEIAHRPHRPAPRPVYHRPRVHRVNTARIVGDIIAAAAINAAIGAIVTALPPYHVEVIINGRVYYLADNILYSPVVINGIPCFEVVNNRYYY